MYAESVWLSPCEYVNNAFMNNVFEFLDQPFGRDIERTNRPLAIEVNPCLYEVLP